MPNYFHQAAQSRPGSYLSAGRCRAEGTTPLGLGGSAEKQEDAESASVTCDPAAAKDAMMTDAAVTKSLQRSHDGRKRLKTETRGGQLAVRRGKGLQK